MDVHGGAISRLFNPGMLAFGNQTIRVNHRLGFDGVLLIYWRGKLVSHNELEDVFGRRFDLVDDGFGNPYMMYRQGLSRRPMIGAFIPARRLPAMPGLRVSSIECGATPGTTGSRSCHSSALASGRTRGSRWASASSWS